MRNVFLIVQRDGPASERGKAKIVKNPDWDGDWEARYFPDVPSERVSAFFVDGIEPTGSSEGFYYTCEMVQGQPGSCMLFVGPGADDAKVQAVEAALRQRHRLDTVKRFIVTQWVD